MHTSKRARANEAQMDNAWQTVPLLKHHLTFFTFRLHRSFCGSTILMFGVLVFGFLSHSLHFLSFIRFVLALLSSRQSVQCIWFYIQITTHYIQAHARAHQYLLCEWENCAWLKIEILFASFSTAKLTTKNTVSQKSVGGRQKLG